VAHPEVVKKLQAVVVPLGLVALLVGHLLAVCLAVAAWLVDR
jgi:hypothetical protein